MPTILKTKNSVTTTVVPTTLQQGELAVNITDKKLWVGNAATTPVQLLGAGVTGDVVGPASATDNAISRFDATTGKLIQNSLVTVSDTGAISAPVDASISGLTVGKGGGTATNSTAVGLQALFNASSTGTENSAFGRQALYSLTSGGSDVAVGNYALYSNTTGNYNTALGYSALQNNTTASENVAVGYQTAYSNTTGTVTAVGKQALYNNTTGASNNAFGNQALVFNTTGGSNSAFGHQALYANTTASNNTAVGYQAGYSATTSGENTAIGYQALYTNSTSGDNVAVGRNALRLSTAAGNTAIGEGGGSAITTGAKNTILGRYTGNQGGLDIRTASNYIVLSDGDGNPRMYSTGASNWVLNSNSGQNESLQYFAINGVNKAEIFYLLSLDRLYVDNGLTGGVYLANGGVAWIANSDERLKENLLPITDAVNKVSTLRAVTGNYIKDEKKKSRPFLIAQDVQAVFPEAVDSSNPEELGVAYTDVIPLLVAAIKELKAEIDQLKGK
jgi:hypothetical protein